MTEIPNLLRLPKDTNGNPIPLTNATPALKFTYDTTISASTEITLNANTSIIRISAIDDNVFLRYGTSDASAATDGADEFIPAGATHDYAIPS